MTAETLPDDALLAAARAGDRAALEALLERYQNRVFSFGLRMCGDAEDAKDVLQDTLLAAARAMPRFRGDASLSTWLYTIARRFCAKQRRRFAPEAHRSNDPAALDQIPASTPDPEVRTRQLETRRALARSLASIDPGMREVLILRDIEGLTAPEVAAITGLSVPAVKSRLHRARAALGARVASALGRAMPARAPQCPDVLAALSKQIEGDLTPQLCDRLAQHVDGCAACRERCDQLKASLAACRSGESPVPEPIRAAVRDAVRTALG